jgi:hypothetical protein
VRSCLRSSALRRQDPGPRGAAAWPAHRPRKRVLSDRVARASGGGNSPGREVSPNPVPRGRSGRPSLRGRVRGFPFVGFCLQMAANILHTRRSSPGAKIGAAAGTFVVGAGSPRVVAGRERLVPSATWRPIRARPCLAAGSASRGAPREVSMRTGPQKSGRSRSPKSSGSSRVLCGRLSKRTPKRTPVSGPP